MLEYRVVTLGYYLDKMRDYELNIVLSNLQYADRPQWEQTRLLGYINAQTQSTKRLDFSDICTFPWERDTQNIETEEETEEQLQALRERALAIEQHINNI